MFKWLQGDPKKSIEKKYHQLLEQARDAQRNGDIIGYSELIDQSEQLRKQIEELETDSASN